MALEKCQGHPCIMKVEGLYKDYSKNYVMVMEYAPAGDLMGYCKKMLKKEEYISEDTLKNCFFNICDTIKYMHSLDVVHGDIKP